MDASEQRFRDLLSRLLDADLSAAERDELAALCEAEPARVPALRAELELAELIRHAAGDDADAAETRFSARVRAVVDDAPASGLDALIHRLLDGDMTEIEIDQLVRHCWRDESAAHALRRALMNDDLIQQAASAARSGEAFVDALATRMWAEQDEDQFVEEVASTIVRMHPELPPAPTFAHREEFGSRAPSVIAYVGGWGAAAAAVIALGMAVLFQPPPPSPVVAVAEVSRVAGEVRWSEGSGPAEARYFVPGRYELESGVVTVAFKGGAEMTVEGPAEFEVEGESGAFLHNGVAVLAKNTAINSDGDGSGEDDGDNRAKGFQLRTAALDLGGSGETIGLIVDGSSSAEAVVFDGGAEVCLPDLGLCRNLFALEPVRADLDRGKLFDVPYIPGVFARAWEVSAGVERNTGPVRIEPPGRSLASTDHPGEVRLFVERNRFISNDDIEVDPLEPGHFKPVTVGDGSGLVSSGRELRSYLLQLRPGDEEPVLLGEDGAVETSVTFDHEIVGVFYSSDRLAASDSLVGMDTTALGAGFSEMRGLDIGSDQIRLSDDRRTLSLKLLSDGADRLDHVRVLVAIR